MGALLFRVFGAFLLAALLSQSVEFTQQYLQRLGGAVDRLAIDNARFDAAAAAEGLDRRQAIQRLSANPDRLIARQAEALQDSATAYAASERRYQAIKNAAPIERPFVALGDPDWNIAKRTADDFRPALPLTAEGLLLTLAGFVLGWALGSGLHGFSRRRRRKDVGTIEELPG